MIGVVRYLNPATLSQGISDVWRHVLSIVGGPEFRVAPRRPDSMEKKSLGWKYMSRETFGTPGEIGMVLDTRRPYLIGGKGSGLISNARCEVGLGYVQTYLRIGCGFACWI